MKTKLINKICLFILFLSISFTVTGLQSRSKANFLDKVRDENSSAFFLNPPPTAVFTSHKNGYTTDQNKITITFELKANNEAIINKDLTVMLGVANSSNSNSESTLSEGVNETQNIRFSSTTQVKTLTFKDVPLFYSGNNYIMCGVFTEDMSEFDLCGGFFYPNFLNIKYTGSLMPLYRFWNYEKQGHFYTINAAEKEYIRKNNFNWDYEGISYFTTKTNKSQNCDGTGKSPVYRFWNATDEHHFYTINAKEKDSILQNDKKWALEGIAFCADINKVANSSPVYRFYSAERNTHFFTINEGEKDSLIAGDPNWNYEGVAYYAFK